QRPRLAVVMRLEQRRGLDAAVERPGLLAPSRADLPDALDRGAGVLREADAAGLGRRPRAAEVVAAAEAGAPVRARGAGPHARASLAPVPRERVDLLAGEVGAAHVPARARAVRAHDE